MRDECGSKTDNGEHAAGAVAFPGRGVPFFAAPCAILFCRSPLLAAGEGQATRAQGARGSAAGLVMLSVPQSFAGLARCTATYASRQVQVFS